MGTDEVQVASIAIRPSFVESVLRQLIPECDDLETSRHDHSQAPAVRLSDDPTFTNLGERLIIQLVETDECACRAFLSSQDRTHENVTEWARKGELDFRKLYGPDPRPVP